MHKLYIENQEHISPSALFIEGQNFALSNNFKEALLCFGESCKIDPFNSEC